MIEFDDLVTALRPVKDALEALDVAWFVGGSVASSWHGASRSTMDVDLVADLNESHVSALLEMLTDEYYSSESAMRDAIERKSCFNLIHLSTSFKVDVFVSRGRPFDASSFARAKPGEIGGNEKLEVPLASAEDIIVSKLEWYRLGNETSERQWDDISRVLRLLGGSANKEYMATAADEVGVADLWNRLKQQLEKFSHGET